MERNLHNIIQLSIVVVLIFVIPYSTRPTYKFDCGDCLTRNGYGLTWNNGPDCSLCPKNTYNDGRGYFCQECTSCVNSTIEDSCTSEHDTICEGDINKENVKTDKTEDWDPCELFTDEQLEHFIKTRGQPQIETTTDYSNSVFTYVIIVVLCIIVVILIIIIIWQYKHKEFKDRVRPHTNNEPTSLPVTEQESQNNACKSTRSKSTKTTAVNDSTKNNQNETEELLGTNGVNQGDKSYSGSVAQPAGSNVGSYVKKYKPQVSLMDSASPP